MAVMNNMREYTKTILIILVLAFVGTIIFDWGMNVTGLKTREGIVGEVEGEEITLRQFDRALTLELKAYRDRTGNEPSESQLSFIRDQVWESLVRDILVRKAMRQKGIKAEDQEIIYRLFNAPPEILKNNPSFLNDKKQFDMAKYQAALNDPRTAGQWRPVEDYLRQTIPYEKFQQRLEASVRVTDDEIRREYLKQYQKAAVKYIFIDPNRFKDQPVEVSQEEIKAYYDQHKDDFHEEEKRKIQYVLFPITTTAEDSSAQYELANRILSRAKNGEDFGELAEIYSEDPGSRDKGGDLGYFARGTMVKEFEDAAFGAKVGEIVGPVKTRFGLHLIKVFDKKKEDGKLKVKASHILLKFQPSEKTKNRARDNADLFAEQAQDGSFEDLAKEYNLSVQTSSLFVKGNGFVPGLGLNKKVSRFIFSHPVGSIGEVEETAQGYFVYRVAEIQEAHTKTLEEVSETIKSKLAAQKRMQMAGELAQKLYDKIQNGTPFEEAAKQDSLEAKETASFTRTGFVPGVGRDPNFIGTAFALEKTGDVSKPVEGTRGYYILKLLNKTPFDEKDFLAKKEELKKQLIQRRQSQVFASWYADVKAKAHIKDLRDRYY